MAPNDYSIKSKQTAILLSTRLWCAFPVLVNNAPPSPLWSQHCLSLYLSLLLLQVLSCLSAFVHTVPSPWNRSHMLFLQSALPPTYSQMHPLRLTLNPSSSVELSRLKISLTFSCAATTTWSMCTIYPVWQKCASASFIPLNKSSCVLLVCSGVRAPGPVSNTR